MRDSRTWSISDLSASTVPSSANSAFPIVEECAGIQLPTRDWISGIDSPPIFSR